MMKNEFYVTMKARFFLKILKVLSWLFGHAEKRFDEKNKVNFKIYDVTNWLTINCNTYIHQMYWNDAQTTCLYLVKNIF